MWRKTVQTVYGLDNTAKTVAEYWEARNLSTDYEIERVKDKDVHGNETVTTTVVDADDGDRFVTRTIVHPDSSTPEVIVSRNGLLQSLTSKSGLTTRYAYDNLGR